MIRGIDSRNELDPTRLLRDTRTVGQRLYDFFSLPKYAIPREINGFLIPGFKSL